MKVANSPGFGLSRKVSTVQQAIPVLGSRTLASLVAGVTLRNSLSGGAVRLDRFWDSSLRCAQLCARLTREFRGVPAEHAYTFGLFHDCGIAVLMQRFPDYRDTLQLANSDTSRPFTEVEEARHATHHAVIGYLLTRNWGLPEDISQATLLHHDLSIFEGNADATAARCRTLVSLAELAGSFVGSFMRMNEDSSWTRSRSAVMAHLGLGENDFHDLREMAFELLEQL
jgi:HD-like signal output (HDOD) protein